MWERQTNQLPVCPLRNLQADHSDTITKNHYARRGETVQIQFLSVVFESFSRREEVTLLHLPWTRQPALATMLPWGHRVSGRGASLDRWAESSRGPTEAPFGRAFRWLVTPDGTVRAES